MENVVRKALAAILALVLAAVFAGCGNKNLLGRDRRMKAITGYSEEELGLLDAYLEHSAGAEISLYKTEYNQEPLYKGVAGSVCGIPEDANTAAAGYVRYSAYFMFEESGNQHITVEGADDAVISVTYNELHTEPYTDDVRFEANVFYKINIGYSLRKNTDFSFRADSKYKMSVNYPSFGGMPSEEVAPVADIHLRDPYIMRGPDGFYYMTGTNDPVDWHNTKEIHVYKSTDLTAWEDLGAVWVFKRDATWQKEILTDGSSPIWAPELHYIRGTYYICYSLGWGSMSGAVLKSTSGLPTGPYVSTSDAPVFDYIDSTFFAEDSGKVYGIWSDGLIAEMNADMSGFKGEVRRLKSSSGNQVGFEGCFLVKTGGLYYLCSSTYGIHYDENGRAYQTYDSYYAVSDRLFGPYSERRLLMTYGGHNNLFFTEDGRLFTTAFYGKNFSERPAVAELEITEEGLLTVK
ncbi:MAG: family 43 glycosylhydrolase [Clostridia bacterium]|nr:family 43 glycosylhydrolase [Clostridia bacterium]